MRTSTILLMAVGLAVAGVIGFVAGRTNAPDPAPVIDDRMQAITAVIPTRAQSVTERATSPDPRAQLLRALAQPAGERDRAVRIAMNAWLAADGAAAIMEAREDPELDDVADRMMRLALTAYPEIVVDHPSLLEGVSDEMIAMAAGTIAMFDAEAARAVIDTHLSGSMMGEAMLAAVDQGGFPGMESRPLEDPRAELESILAERGMMRRLPRLIQLVARVAADDPRAAAELIDKIPQSSRRHAMQPLLDVWARTNPEEAARWLARKSTQTSREGFSHLGRGWGTRDFEAASTFADTLTGGDRAAFLAGLVSASHRLPRDEMLAWASRYEGEPVYADLVRNVAGRFVQEDVDAAMELIETLPEEARLMSYQSVLPQLAFDDPESAIALIDEIGNESLRDQLLPMVSSMWGNNDAESALDWALGLDSGPARDRAIASISGPLMEFDLDRAIDAIDEIDDPDVRRHPVRQLLRTVESDDEAIRIGRTYDLDREAVLELRESRRGVLGPVGFSQYHIAPPSGTVVLRTNTVVGKDPDPE